MRPRASGADTLVISFGPLLLPFRTSSLPLAQFLDRVQEIGFRRLLIGLDQAGLEMDRRFNFDGIYFDRDGNQQIYEDQTDNYAQNHFQLHAQRYGPDSASHEHRPLFHPP